MSGKPGKLARVERWDEGTVVVKIGDFPLRRYPIEIQKESADIFTEEINRALSPLLARAELLEKAVEVIKEIISTGRVEEGDGIWLGHSGQLKAEEILTAYASLPKMPEGKVSW